ncbi:MAG: hypothetical protein ACREVK_09680 [Gammaproteobacteria bacterium]
MSVYEKALLDPTSALTSREQVLTSAELSRKQKIENLHRWEYDAWELEVAEEENMLSDSDQPGILDEISRCLHALGAGLDTARCAPTKQGGA